MARKGILSPTLKMILKTRYPLRRAKPESSGGDQIKSDSLDALPDGQKKETWGLSPAARPHMSGIDQE